MHTLYIFEIPKYEITTVGESRTGFTEFYDKQIRELYESVQHYKAQMEFKQNQLDELLKFKRAFEDIERWSTQDL